MEHFLDRLCDGIALGFGATVGALLLAASQWIFQMATLIVKGTWAALVIDPILNFRKARKAGPK